MTLNLTFLNPITECDEFLVINYPDFNYKDNLIEFKNIESDDNYYINYLFKQLESFANNYGVNSWNYANMLSKIYYFSLRINNQLLYNSLINRIINEHIHNIKINYHNEFFKKLRNNSPKGYYNDLFNNNLCVDEVSIRHNKHNNRSTSSSKKVTEKTKRKIKSTSIDIHTRISISFKR